MSVFEQAALFLINAIFDIAIIVVLFRFLLQLCGADYYNPLTQGVVKITRFVLQPVSSVLPSYKRINFAALLLVILLEIIKLSLLLLVHKTHVYHVGGILLWAIGDLLSSIVNVFFYAILIQAVLSWIRPQGVQALLEILYRLTFPLLQPLHRIIPPLGGIDITPIIALIGLKLVQIVLINPIIKLGMLLVLQS